MNKNDFEDVILKSFKRIQTDKEKIGMIFIDSLKGRQAKFFVGDKYFTLDCDDVGDILKEVPDISEESLSNLIVNNILQKMEEISFKPFTDDEFKEGLEDISKCYENFSYEILDDRIKMEIGGKKMAILKVVLNRFLRTMFNKKAVFEELKRIIGKNITSLEQASL